MAHVALERLGEAAPATIRLHPDDYATVMAGSRPSRSAGARSTIVPDPAVSRGGCLVESEFGFIDASVDAQFDEIDARRSSATRRRSSRARRGVAR